MRTAKKGPWQSFSELGVSGGILSVSSEIEGMKGNVGESCYSNPNFLCGI
jgi:hypothetical protein